MAALHALAADRAPGALIFTTGEGRPLDSCNALSRWLVPAAERAGIGRIGWHALRHSYVDGPRAPGRVARGGPAAGRHASIAITLEVYTHLDAGDLDAAVDAAVPASAAAVGRREGPAAARPPGRPLLLRAAGWPALRVRQRAG